MAERNLSIPREIVTAGMRRCAKVSDALHAVASRIIGRTRRAAQPMTDLEKLTHAVLRVGGGRGFVVEGADDPTRLVITAAHCLPRLPPVCPHLEDLTYEKLLDRKST